MSLPSYWIVKARLGSNGRAVTFYATSRKEVNFKGQASVVYSKCKKDGDDYSYYQGATLVENISIMVLAPSSIISETPAEMSRDYGWIVPVSKKGE